MTQTRSIDIPPGDWLLVTENSPAAVVQVQSPHSVRLHVGETKPNQNDHENGVTLKDTGQAFTVGGLDTAADKVYLRTVGEKASRVVVIDQPVAAAPQLN